MAGPDLGRALASFGDLLHSAGVPVTPERTARFVTAVDSAAPATVEELYWLGRVTLLTDREQVPRFDAVFGQVFRGWSDVADSRGDTANSTVTPREMAGEQRREGPSRRSDEGIPGGSPMDAGEEGVDEDDEDDADGDEDEPVEAESVQMTASVEERLRAKDFSTLTADELDQLRGLIAALRFAPPRRPSRRRSRHRSGDELDVRATLRLARRTGGDPVTHVHRRPRDRPRRLVLIADVSGSMEAYARAYLHLLHGAVRAARAEAFVFSTRLTQLTRALATYDPDLALARAAAAAPDWSGGTRIGAALKEFNDRHGRRGLARGAVVVIVSDGWEQDAPELLAEQLERLTRLAHRIVWVNPRKASETFQPLAGGMAAALPYVDSFVSGHSVRALDEVIAAISGSGGSADVRGR